MTDNKQIVKEALVMGRRISSNQGWSKEHSTFGKALIAQSNLTDTAALIKTVEAMKRVYDPTMAQDDWLDEEQTDTHNAALADVLKAIRGEGLQ